MIRLITLSLVTLFLASCESVAPPQYDSRSGVKIADRWQLDGSIVDSERSTRGGTVLRAAAQNGARLSSLTPPLHTRVHTVIQADEIYYNAFLRRFDLFGDVVITQGQHVRSGRPITKWSMHEDGSFVSNPDDPMVVSDRPAASGNK